MFKFKEEMCVLQKEDKKDEEKKEDEKKEEKKEEEKKEEEKKWSATIVMDT